jgi:short-subunit dehydrogenase
VIAALGGEGARQPAPVRSTVQSLAEALQVELQGDGVAVPAAAPGPTHSGFAARAGMRLGAAVDPEAIAQPILDALGRQATVLPGALSKLLSWSPVPLPRWARASIMGSVMQAMAIR